VHRFSVFVPTVGDAGTPLNTRTAGVTATGMTAPGEITARVVAVRVGKHAGLTAAVAR
jgi:hypothetical protein